MNKDKRDELKQKLSEVNKELRKHGGNANRVKISHLKEDQLLFLYDLLHSHLEKYKEIAKEDLEIFHEEKLENNPHFRIFTNVHAIQIPEKYDNEWELEICRSVFGTELVMFDIKEWKVLNKSFVG